jgi:hypothetical protein
MSQIARPAIKRTHAFFSCAPIRSEKNAGLEKEKHMIRTSVWIKLLTGVLLTAGSAFAQSSDRLPVTDADKIADALRAGPAFITKDATVRDWPTAPGGEYRLLRKGSNEWTCLPAIPGYSYDEPACFDPIFPRWIEDSLAGRTPQIDRIGISYMYFGAWQKGASSGHEFHVGHTRDDGVRDLILNDIRRFTFPARMHYHLHIRDVRQRVKGNVFERPDSGECQQQDRCEYKKAIVCARFNNSGEHYMPPVAFTRNCFVPRV